jgi:hypothetical protein
LLASIVVNLLLAMSALSVRELCVASSAIATIVCAVRSAHLFVDVRNSVAIEDRIGDIRFYISPRSIFDIASRAAGMEAR